VVTVPLWAWILLSVALLLLVGWNYDRKRRMTRGLDQPAVTYGNEAQAPREARRNLPRGDSGFYCRGGP
jgi:hypothetical protein